MTIDPVFDDDEHERGAVRVRFTPVEERDLEAEADEPDALTATDLERIDAESEHVVIERAATLGDWHQW